MSSSDQHSDPLYQQFKLWQQQQGYQSPDYFADPQQQQFDLFQQMLAFQEWQRQQEGQPPTPPLPSASDGVGHNATNPTWHAEVQQLAGALNQLAQQVQANPVGETPTERADRLEREFQTLLQPTSDTKVETHFFDLSSQGDSAANSSTVHEEHFPHYSAADAPPRRSSRLPLLVGLLVVGATAFLIFILFAGSGSGPLFASANLQITQYVTYTEGSDLHIVGVVKNAGDGTTKGVQVNAVLRDSKGRAAAEDSDSTLEYAPLAPSQSAGFDVNIYSPPSKWDKLEVNATESSYQPSMATGLVVSSSVITPTRNGYTGSGKVSNNGPTDARTAHVVVTAYDAAGKVLAVASVLAGSRDGIDAGQSTDFSIDLRRVDIKVAHFDTFVFGDQKR